MKKHILLAFAMTLAAAGLSAQDGQPFIHDPSTIVECEGRYYTFGTGGGGLISSDGWNWHKGAVRPGGGAAPDVMKIDGRYLVAYSATGGGLGGGHAGKVLTMWANTLNPESPDFGFTDPVEAASSLDDEDCDAIDAGLLLDPATGRLWLSYGTYFGFIRMVELDPATGKRVEGNEPVDVAIDCEATVPLYRNGWYYLLGTHGTCCDGPNSTYNIVVGRSRNPTGPFVDNIGRDMLMGGGKMVVAASEGKTGAGHFGRYVVEDGVEKMSFHYEADFERGGMSVLAVKPLVWENDWPVVGDDFTGGNYEIVSRRRGYALELAVDFIRMDVPRLRFWEEVKEPLLPLKKQTLDDVVGSWPEGVTGIRLGDYMFRPHQRWTLKPVPEKGGYLGGVYYKITIEGTERALAAAEGREVVAVPQFTGADEQLWRIEQLTDGTYRIMPKSVPGSDEEVVLMSVADSTPSLGNFDFNSDNCKWSFKRLD